MLEHTTNAFVNLVKLKVMATAAVATYLTANRANAPTKVLLRRNRPFTNRKLLSDTVQNTTKIYIWMYATQMMNVLPCLSNFIKNATKINPNAKQTVPMDNGPSQRKCIRELPQTNVAQLVQPSENTNASVQMVSRFAPL